MAIAELQIIPNDLPAAYSEQVPRGLRTAFDALHDAEISTGTFSFYTSVSSVYSSKIEGEDIELDSYVKHKRFGIEFLPDYTKKTDDLYSAYTFAKGNDLDPSNISEAHRLLSKHLVPAHWQGEFRSRNMYVTTPDGNIAYVAALPHEVGPEMKKLFADMTALLHAELSMEEVFYYAAFIH